jgi:hypothetical protein
LLEKKKEADASSSHPELLRTDAENKHKDLKFIASSLKESSDQASGGRRFRVTIIKEGLGNFADAFYYPKEALSGLAAILEGKKFYANHPTARDESERPERDVREIIGWFENVSVETQGSQSNIVGDAVILEGEAYEWARSLMRDAIRYRETHPDKDLVGLSINASGDSEVRPIDEVFAIAPQEARAKLQEAKAKGIEQVRYVTSFTDAVSADLVTEAGAGGSINQMLEQEKDKMSKKKEGMNEADGHPDAAQDKQLIMDMIKKHLGDSEGGEESLLEGTHKELCEMGYEAEEAAKMCAAMHKLEKKRQEKAAEAAKAEEKPEDKVEENEKLPIEQPKESKKLVELQGKVAFLESKLKAVDLEKYIDKKLAETKLPRSATDKLRESLKDVKTEKQFDQMLGWFMEGYKAKPVDDAGLFGFMVEKNTTVADGAGELSFADCLKD